MWISTRFSQPVLQVNTINTVNKLHNIALPPEAQFKWLQILETRAMITVVSMCSKTGSCSWLSLIWLWKTCQPTLLQAPIHPACWYSAGHIGPVIIQPFTVVNKLLLVTPVAIIRIVYLLWSLGIFKSEIYHIADKY